MTLEANQNMPKSDFRIKATFGVTLVGLIFLTPFSINNFTQGRPVLGIGSLIVVALCAIIARQTRGGRYNPKLVLTTLVPVIIFFLAYAIHQQGMIGILWCYPAILSFYFMLPEGKARLANLILLTCAFPEAWLELDAQIASRVLTTLSVVSIFSAIFIRVIGNQQQLLQERAVTDPLTGLSNRMLLGDLLEQAVEQNHRAGTPMTLLALDLDHFKNINDTLGHDAGDTVLRGIGEYLHKRVRQSDRAFRSGGEEFIILMYNTNTDSAQSFAEQVRNDIQSLSLIPNRTVTASIGVATLIHEEEWRRWVKRADENLYRAKAAGRNCVIA